MEDNSFKMFIPIEFEKSETTTKTGKKSNMKFKGIASNMKTGADLDGEVLDVNGFDYAPLLKSGHINWNHGAGKDPLAIVGEPTSAVVKNNEFHIEGVLYSDSELAQKIYKAAEIMEKSGSTRKLGFSIEGNATERDPINKKLIKKATVMNVAICPTPKNAGTAFQLVKSLEFDTTTVASDDMIVDVESNGERVLIDKAMNVAIIKSTDVVLSDSEFQGNVIAVSEAIQDVETSCDINVIKAHLASFRTALNGKIWVGSKLN